MGAVAPLGMGTGCAVRFIGPQARVGRIVQALVEPRRAAVAEQARGEGVDARPREPFLQAEVAALGGGVSQVEKRPGRWVSAVDQHRRPGGSPRAFAVRVDRLDAVDLQLRREPSELWVPASDGPAP